MSTFSSRLKQSNLQIFGYVLLVILITENIESVAVDRFRREVGKNQNFTDLNNVLEKLNRYCDSQQESTNDQVKSLTKEEISNSISDRSRISQERTENAIIWLYEALQIYANDNWKEGNQNQICLYLKTSFDTAYGPYWICMTSRKNEPVYGVVTYDLKEGLIMFNLPNGLAFEVIKPKGGNYILGNPSSLSKQEILESIWNVSTLKKERVENATLWMHDALKQYADENWVDGNQAQICAYMSTKFDETYGAYWLCSTSERNKNIYDLVRADTKEGFIRFGLKNGLLFLIFKAPCGNSKGQVKSLTREEIANSIIQPSTVLDVIKEDVTTWLYESLKLYADDNWVEGNQNKICTDVGKKLDKKYEQYWACMASPSNDHNIYGYNTYEQKDGVIYFDLPNGLLIQIVKIASRFFRMTEFLC